MALGSYEGRRISDDDALSCSGRCMPKRKRSLGRVRWVKDLDAPARQEPGLTHSFVASLATVIDCLGFVVDPIWLMGATGFAFRIWIEERMLPSAMNAFDWVKVLPEAVRQAGFNCMHVHRLAQEADVEARRREIAHAAIIRSIDRGVPAIIWDPADPPMWGLITGYNDHTEMYDASAFWSYEMPLPYDRLGRRAVDRLSVILLQGGNDLDKQSIARRSLELAIDHSQGRDGMPFPLVHTGLQAYEHWAKLMNPHHLATHELQFANYYAEMFFSFRCYARDYLAVISGGNEHLEAASAAYADVADELRPVHELLQEQRCPSNVDRRALGECILRAGSAETRAIGHIAAFQETS